MTLIRVPRIVIAYGSFILSSSLFKAPFSTNQLIYLSPHWENHSTATQQLPGSMDLSLRLKVSKGSTDHLVHICRAINFLNYYGWSISLSLHFPLLNNQINPHLFPVGYFWKHIGIIITIIRHPRLSIQYGAGDNKGRLRVERISSINCSAWWSTINNQSKWLDGTPWDVSSQGN